MGDGTVGRQAQAGGEDWASCHANPDTVNLASWEEGQCPEHVAGPLLQGHALVRLAPHVN